MKEYIVDVVRIGYSSHTIRIHADNCEEAEEKAIQHCQENVEFRESSSEYTIGFCDEA